MNRSAYLVFFISAAVFVAGVFQLANRELAGGAVYPEYSSLRADPDGSKLLFDGLVRLPGISVDRSFLPLSGSQEKRAAILLIGVAPQSLNALEELLPVGALAGAGNRIVVTFRYQRSLTELNLSVLEKTWGVRTGTDKNGPRAHPFFFRESKGWTALRMSGAKILAMERPFDQGSILLIAESNAFANDSVLAGIDIDLVSQAIGDYHRVVFDESHLGISESGSVIALARRFRLLGFVAGLALCALLFLWKNVPIFPPPSSVRTSSRSGITAQAGLVTLLRRHIPAKDVAAACWRAWLETNRRSVTQSRIADAERILVDPAAPAETLRRVGALVQSKGEL
jgi:hypothetical protein